MKIASVADVKSKFSEYVKASDTSPVVITRNGKAVAAIIAINDEQDLEQLALGYSPRLRAILSAARRRLRAGKGVSHERLWSEVQSRNKKPQKR